MPVDLTKTPKPTVPPAPRGPVAMLLADRQPAPMVDTSAPIIPMWLRDGPTFRSTVKNWVRYYGYRTAFVAFYVPKLAALLVLYSPRGVVRAVGWLSRWIYDWDSAQLRHQHAGNTETPEYVKAQNVRRANLQARLLVFGTSALVVVGPVLAWNWPKLAAWLVAFGVFCWVCKLIPGRGLDEVVVAATVAVVVGVVLTDKLATIPRPPVWLVWVVAAGLVALFGWVGRPVNGRLVQTAMAASNVVEPIRAPLVMAALCSLGNARMSPRTQEEHETSIRLLMDVARSGAGYQVDMELPPAVPASFVQEKREEFAAALRRELGCVWPSVGKRHPGHLSLYISDQPMSDAPQTPWALLKGPRVNLFLPTPMFTSNVGKWIDTTFAYTSWVIGAVPRMGKTYAIRQIGLVAGLDVRSKVYVFDLKGTGDLSSLAHFAHAYGVGDEPEDVALQLQHMRALRTEMRRRARLIRELTLEENPEKGKVTDALASHSPARFCPIVVEVDECQVWFEHEDKPVRDEFIAICTDLVKRGPALGIICVFATQKPDAKSIPSAISENAIARLCFKVTGQVSNDQVLGTSSYKEGLRATQFGFRDKGVAYYRGEGADPLIVRTVHGLNATVAEELALKARGLRIQAGLLTGQANDEEVVEMMPDLLDDVREVLAEAGDVNMSLPGLLERLDLLRPTHYGQWDAPTLSARLRALRVRVETVHCPEEKESLRGTKPEWVHEAIKAREQVSA